MGIENTNVIDIIAKSPHIDGYDLIISDPGKITDQVKRYNLFIEKALSYLNYVYSGQFRDDYPDAKGKQVRICVICAKPPNEAMLKVEAIKSREDESMVLPVVFQTQEEYVGKKAPKKKWFEFWK